MNRIVVALISGVVSGLAVGNGAQAQETEGANEDNRVVLQNPGEVEEVVVLGQFIPGDKRITSEVANMLDYEELALMTDTDVGGALSRVTGLSLVGDKYVYVRGLGERYSSTVLDGSRLSSPVPFPEDRAARHRPRPRSCATSWSRRPTRPTCRAISAAAR